MQNNPDELLQLALQAKDYLKKLEYTAKFLELDPSNKDVWLYRRNVCKELGLTKEEIQCIEKSVEGMGSKYQFAQYCLGENDEKALHILTTEVLEKEPRALIIKGRALMGLKRFEEAISCFDKVLETRINKICDIEAYYWKGSVLIDKEDYIEALKCFDDLMEIDPGHCFSWVSKAYILAYKLERYESAIAIINENLQYLPAKYQDFINDIYKYSINEIGYEPRSCLACGYKGKMDSTFWGKTKCPNCGNKGPDTPIISSEKQEKASFGHIKDDNSFKGKIIALVSKEDYDQIEALALENKSIAIELAYLLEHSDEEIREIAVEAISRIGKNATRIPTSIKAIMPVIDNFLDSRESPFRGSAIAALTGIAWNWLMWEDIEELITPYLHRLIYFLDDNDHEIRKQALEGILVYANWMEDKDLSLQNIEAIIPTLTLFLEEPKLRMTTTLILSSISRKNPRILKPLTGEIGKLLMDEKEQVRLPATFICRYMSEDSPETTRCLFPHLEYLLNKPDEWERVQEIVVITMGFLAIDETEAQKVLPALIKLLDDTREFICADAIKALTKIGAINTALIDRALPKIQELAHDSRIKVRENAQTALSLQDIHEILEQKTIAWRGGVYTGQVLNDVPHGKGGLILPDNTKYEGEWEAGKPSGLGKIAYSSGSSYEGYFLNGKRHGKGKYYKPDGKVYEGIWANGEFKG